MTNNIITINVLHEATESWGSAEVGVAQSLGKRRENQEDFAAVEKAGRFAVVADGVGGHPRGEEASHVAVLAAVAVLTSTKSTGKEAVREAHAAALQAVLDLEEPSHTSFPPATTIVIALHDPENGQWIVGNVGDSRVWSVTSDALVQVTIDHENWDGSLTRWLGWEGGNTIDTFKVPESEGQILILATDGLFHHEPTDDDILDIVNANTDLVSVAVGLTQIALDNGGRDNITVAVLDGSPR